MTKRKVATDSKATQTALAVIALIDSFCAERLNSEYAEVCRRLTEKLARKRPSPLSSGKAETWACAIVRTIGWVNFLSDPKQSPHLKMSEIDAGFGVSESTGQSKSLQIRKMLRIGQLSTEWCLPSSLDDNSMAWMIQVNGFVLDARKLPLEIQEAAFSKGLIPYIPSQAQEEN